MISTTPVDAIVNIVKVGKSYRAHKKFLEDRQRRARKFQDGQGGPPGGQGGAPNGGGGAPNGGGAGAPAGGQQGGGPGGPSGGQVGPVGGAQPGRLRSNAGGGPMMMPRGKKIFGKFFKKIFRQPPA